MTNLWCNMKLVLQLLNACIRREMLHHSKFRNFRALSLVFRIAVFVKMHSNGVLVMIKHRSEYQKHFCNRTIKMYISICQNQAYAICWSSTLIHANFFILFLDLCISPSCEVGRAVGITVGLLVSISLSSSLELRLTTLTFDIYTHKIAFTSHLVGKLGLTAKASIS